MKTIPKKFAPLFTTFLVMVGGFLAFPHSDAKAERTRTVSVFQNGVYVANLCVKNVSQNREACTGKIKRGTKRDLTIPWNPGDKILFKNDIVAGPDEYYGPLADRDTHCWSDGTIFARNNAYCRMASEAPHGKR